VAAVIGDSVGYAIGRRLGPRLFTREDSLLFKRAHLMRTRHFFEKYGAKTIVLARFVPIVRTFAPTVAGVGEMPYRTFITFNVAGGVSWVLSMTSIGYFLGRSIPNIEKRIHYVILIVIFLSFLPLVKEWLQHRKEGALSEQK
jgi:membrane-associated protein